MSEFRLVNSESKLLTKELALEFRSLEPSPTERDLNPGRVKHLRQKAVANHLVTFNWSTARFGDRHLRMNGQHSSTMLCDLNGAFPDGLKVHLDEYEVDDEAGLAILFRQFDDRKSGRTCADVAGAYQGCYPPLRGIPKAAAKLAVEGVSWWRWEVERLPVPSGDDAYSLMGWESLHPFIKWIGNFFTTNAAPELKQRSIVAALHATFHVNEEEARLFWALVAHGGIEYEDNAPATVLDDWLKSVKDNKDPKKAVRQHSLYQGCIYAWNAHREGKTPRRIKYEVIKGQPLLTPIR